MQIYHSGSKSYIKDTGTGNLAILTSTLELNNAADSQNMIVANEGGAVTLFHSGSAKLATTTTGIDVTGNIGVSGTVDGIDIAARDAVLTSTTTTAGAALPKAGGTMTGGLTGTTGTFSGKIKTTAGELEFTSANHQITTGNANNIKLKIGTTGAAGVALADSNNSFVLQVYGDSSGYGFLNSEWGSWNLRKSLTGALYLNNNNTYYINPADTSNLNDVQAQSYKIGTTTVIDGSRVLTNLQGAIKSDTTFAFLTTADGAQNIRTKSVFAGTSYGDTPPAGSFNATNTYEQNGTTVIDASRNLTNIGTISSGAITTTGILTLDTSPASNGTGDLRIIPSLSNSSGVGYAGQVLGVNIATAVHSTHNAPVVSNTWGGVTGATAIALQADDNSYGQFQVWTAPQDSSANDLLVPRFYIAGSGAATFTGNVGIGTSSPAAGLQVSKGLTNAGGPAAGASTASACFGNDGSDDNYGLVLGADGNGLGYISAQRTDGTATAYPLVIQHTGGNVGIGTNNPAQKLDVNGAIRFTPNTADTNYSADIAARYDSAHPFELSVKNNGSSAEYFGVYADGGGANNRVAFPTGNVGIGTTDPAALLHAHNTTEEVIRVDSGDTGAIHFFEGSTRRGILGYSNGTSIASTANAGDMVLRTEAGKKLHLAISGTSKMVIDSYGNVGIGTANPSRLQYGSVDPKLHVDQTWVTGSYNLTARFSAGGDADNTGASILINHANDRGLLIEAGREILDTGIAHFGIVNSGGTNTRLMTLKQGVQHRYRNNYSRL